MPLSDVPPQDGTSDLGNRITKLYAHINVATAELLRLIADFDAAGLAARDGALSTAHWLNYRCGIGLNAAREKVRVARSLSTLPLIARSFARGQLSYSKVRALTRVANVGNEADLLQIARHATAAQAERILRQYRQTLDRETSPQLGEPKRAASELGWRWTETGELVFSGRLPPELGALLVKAVEQRMDQEADCCQPSSTEHPEPMAERRASALVSLAEASLEAIAGSGSSAERYQVHVELTPDGANLEEGSGLHAATVERLTCDASLVLHEYEKNGEAFSVGRKTRTVPSALRRALKRRDRGCRFPGCTHHRFVDAHHVQHWAHGGETRLDNLVLLCRRHHRAVHEQRFRVEAERPSQGATRFHFFTPTGEPLPGNGEQLANGSVQALFDVTAETPIDQDALRALGRDRPDYHHINWVLTQFVPRE